MQIIKSSDWKVTNWSGGTTSELFISPSTAEFKKANYQLRISIATVEVEKSTFTPLPGIDRTLTVLEGEIELIHEGHHTKKLQTYEQDSFLGDWNTKSIGKVRDFNVMTQGRKATVEVIKLMKNQVFEVNKGEFIYLAKGELNLGGHLLENDAAVLCEKTEEGIVVFDCVVVRVCTSVSLSAQ